MKGILSVLMIAGLLGCSDPSSPSTTIRTILSGTINDPNSDVIRLIIDDKVLESKIQYDSFTMMLSLEKPGYQTLEYGQNQIPLYLEPDDKIHLSFDASTGRNSIRFIGKGSESNNYLSSFHLFVEQEEPSEGMLFGLAETEFVGTVSMFRDNCLQFLQSYITNHHNLDPHFFEKERARIWYKWGQYLIQYPTVRSYMSSNNEDPISPSYFHFQEELSMDESGLIDVPEYLNYVVNALQLEARHLSDAGMEENPLKVAFDLIPQRISNQDVRNHCYYRIMEKILRASQFQLCGELMRKYKQRNTDSNLRRGLFDQYHRYLALQPGELAPSFEALDIDKKVIRSDQFSGHILYVTVWTSNCSSCQAQLVALDKLSRQYENEAVGILSISVDASFEDWKKSLAGRPWTSQHAYVEGGLSSEFCKSYLIEGTPRNIMIGKNGE
ncbi:MAG: TlpA family protein disulfide reductase, partial [Saprospiraceae bacterium]|nr:TlpA family protein disulfide reductase [Saprospiraceae bacterium]